MMPQHIARMAIERIEKKEYPSFGEWIYCGALAPPADRYRPESTPKVVPPGADQALAAQLVAQDARLQHEPGTVVITSGRLIGRAKGWGCRYDGAVLGNAGRRMRRISRTGRLGQFAGDVAKAYSTDAAARTIENNRLDGSIGDRQKHMERSPRATLFWPDVADDRAT
jgi:hypothetical protein